VYTASCYVRCVARSVEDPLVAKAFDRTQSHDELAQAIAKLSPDEAAFFLHRLEMAMRKRKIQLTGYLVALLAWLAGMVLALVLFYFGGMSGWSAAWVFIVPLGIVGAILYGFGTWAERVARRPPPAAPPAT
jgi:hypothetical protein